MIFPEQALECLTSCKTCSEIEDSRLSLAAQNGLRDEVVRVSEVDAVGLSEKNVKELEGATIDLLETLASLIKNRRTVSDERKSTNSWFISTLLKICILFLNSSWKINTPKNAAV